jgi:malate synthase
MSDNVLPNLPAGVEVNGPIGERFAEVLQPAALDFVAGLHRRFNPQRESLLERRAARFWQRLTMSVEMSGVWPMLRRIFRSGG